MSTAKDVPKDAPKGWNLTASKCLSFSGDSSGSNVAQTELCASTFPSIFDSKMT